MTGGGVGWGGRDGRSGGGGVTGTGEGWWCVAGTGGWEAVGGRDGRWGGGGVARSDGGVWVGWQGRTEGSGWVAGTEGWGRGGRDGR